MLAWIQIHIHLKIVCSQCNFSLQLYKVFLPKPLCLSSHETVMWYWSSNFRNWYWLSDIVQSGNSKLILSLQLQNKKLILSLSANQNTDTGSGQKHFFLHWPFGRLFYSATLTSSSRLPAVDDLLTFSPDCQENLANLDIVVRWLFEVISVYHTDLPQGQGQVVWSDWPRVTT